MPGTCEIGLENNTDLGNIRIVATLICTENNSIQFLCTARQDGNVTRRIAESESHRLLQKLIKSLPKMALFVQSMAKRHLVLKDTLCAK